MNKNFIHLIMYILIIYKWKRTRLLPSPKDEGPALSRTRPNHLINTKKAGNFPPS